MIEPIITTMTSSEVRELLDTPKFLKNLGLSSIDDIISFKHDMNLLSFGQYRLAFVFWEVAPTIYEVHIACPRDSIIVSRDLVLIMLTWMFESVGAKVIITSCSDTKTANMARKLGFKEVKRVEDKMYFILLTENYLDRG